MPPPAEQRVMIAPKVKSFLKKVPRIPRWLYDRVRWDVIYPIELMRLKYSSYDYKTLFSIVSKLTGVTPEAARAYYEEIHHKGVLDELKQRIEAIPDLGQERRMIKLLSMEKYVRLDRTVLYCIVRA